MTDPARRQSLFARKGAADFTAGSSMMRFKLFEDVRFLVTEQ
jgi:hypothetical protein